MKVAALEFEDKVGELLVCLDRDIVHLQNSLFYLNELRTAVIKRDDVALRKLFDDIQVESNSYRSNESNRQIIRKELADCLGRAFEQTTLTVLEASLPLDKKAMISRRKAKLEELIGQLKAEYSGTAVLLSECTRFNNQLLKSIFDLGKTGEVYYSANGAAQRKNESAFVNLQL